MYLKFELGVVRIVGKSLIQATYNLEGDNCCALVTYGTIMNCKDLSGSTRITKILHLKAWLIIDECVHSSNSLR